MKWILLLALWPVFGQATTMTSADICAKTDITAAQAALSVNIAAVKPTCSATDLSGVNAKLDALALAVSKLSVGPVTTTTNPPPTTTLPPPTTTNPPPTTTTSPPVTTTIPVGTVDPKLPTMLAASPASFSVAQNSSIQVTINFNAMPLASDTVNLFVHVYDANNNFQAIQGDVDFIGGAKTWSGLKSFVTTLSVPPGTPLGTYHVTAGLFTSDAGYPKLNMNASSGAPQAFKDQGNEFTVATFTITQGAAALPTNVGPDFSSTISGAGDPLNVTYSDDFHPAGMHLTFHDEFNGTSLNQTTWKQTYMYQNRQLNDEQECYLEANDTVSGGILSLTAKKESGVCPKPAVPYSYSSGVINSQSSFSQTNGYFSIRAKLPMGQGMWPAFWLMPSNGTWPPELDIFEYIGARDPNKLYMTYHYSGANLSDAGSVFSDLQNNFHVWGVDLEPGVITWYLDGKQMYQTQSSTASSVYAGPWYILANLAVGGGWPGSVDPAILPQAMQVDWIRVYSK